MRFLGIDVGTTFVKSYFFDGQEVKKYRTPNFQYIFGNDVLQRASKALESEKSYNDVRKKLLETVNEHKKYFGGNFDKVILIGNSVMEHFYYGFDLKSLVKTPFRRVEYEESFDKNEIFLKGFKAFIGSDLYPLLKKMKDSSEKKALGFDVGTNCEIFFKKEEKFYITSAPAGPAFENLAAEACGKIMDVSFNGAFSYVLDDYDVSIKYILPKAFVKLVYFLKNVGLIENNGNLNTEIKVGDFRLTQEKIREFQKAKAAIATAWKSLINVYNDGNMPEKLYLCGNMLDEESAEYLKKLGVFPNIDIEFLPDVYETFFKYLYENMENLKHILIKLRENIIYVPHFNFKDFEKEFIKELNF